MNIGGGCYISNKTQKSKSHMDLEFYWTSRGRHAHQNVRNVQHIGHSLITVVRDFMRVELSHSPLENSGMGQIGAK